MSEKNCLFLLHQPTLLSSTLVPPGCNAIDFSLNRSARLDQTGSTPPRSLPNANANPYNFTQSTLIFRFYFLYFFFILPLAATDRRSFGSFMCLAAFTASLFLLSSTRCCRLSVGILWALAVVVIGFLLLKSNDTFGIDQGESVRFGSDTGCWAETRGDAGWLQSHQMGTLLWR